MLPLQGFFERTFSVWPISKLFELHGSIHEWWFRWKLDRFVSVSQRSLSFCLFLELAEHLCALSQAVIHGMLFAFLYLVLQKRQVLSEGKGEALFSTRISNLLLFLSFFCFIVRLLRPLFRSDLKM